MNKKIWKRVTAIACAGAMMVTGMNFDLAGMEAEASSGWVWNAEYSESGYKKIPYAQLTATADSEQTDGEGASVDLGGNVVHGQFKNVVDGSVRSFWHTKYDNRGNGTAPTVSGDIMTGNNTITITFNDDIAREIQGITVLPRQDAYGNGALIQFDVQVSTDGSVWTDAKTDVVITEHGSQNAWSGNKAEKEVLFDDIQSGIKAVRLVAKRTGAAGSDKTSSGTGGHITAAEISILTSDRSTWKDEVKNLLTEAKAELEALKLKNSAETYSVPAQYKKVDAQLTVLSNIETDLSEGSYTEEDKENFQTQIANAIAAAKMFEDENGRGVYLSDLDWSSNTATGWGFIQKDGEVTNNATVNKIRLYDTTDDSQSIKSYAKGVGTHATSNLYYDIAGKGYKRFETHVGVDASMTANSSITFVVYVDGVEVARTHEMRYQEGKQKISVDLPSNASTLRLEANAGTGNGSDHADFADAKLYTELVAVPEISVQAPAGRLVPTILPNTTAYDVSTTWTEAGTDMQVTRFEAGKTYTMTAVFTAKEGSGYYFDTKSANEFVMRVNKDGVTSTVTSTTSEVAENKQSMTVTYTFDEAGNTIGYSNIANTKESITTYVGTEVKESATATNLTDGRDDTLYKFDDTQLAADSTKSVVLKYAYPRTVDACRIAFEKVSTEEYNYQFTYSILAKNDTDTDYTTIVSEATANRTDNWEQKYSVPAKQYTEFKIVIHDCTTSSGKGWPAIAEFELYAEQYNNVAKDNVTITPESTGGTGGYSKEHLVDGDDSTIFRIHDDVVNSDKSVTLNYPMGIRMNAFRIAFEHSNDLHRYLYSIYAKNGEGAWDTIVDHHTATRKDYWEQKWSFAEKVYTDVKITVHRCDYQGVGDGWCSIGEFEVYGTVDDRTILESAVAAAEKISALNPANKAEIEAAIQATKATIGNPVATITDVNTAKDTLTNKMSAAVVTPDTGVTSGYTVTVVGGTLSNSEELNTVGGVTVNDANTQASGLGYNQKVTVQAPAEVDNKAFTGWSVLGDIVSVNTTYTFYVPNNVTITAVYGEKTPEPAATISNVTVTQNTNDSTKVDVKFVGQLTIPEGYELAEAGLVYKANAAPAGALVNANGPTEHGSYAIAAKVNTSYQYSMTFRNVNPSSVTCLYGAVCAKLLKTDGSSDTIWVYSETVKVNTSTSTGEGAQ